VSAAHFVLDHNFPMFAVGFEWPRPDLRVSRLWDIDRELTRDHDDWEVLRALHNRGRIDGFVTNDDKMLRLPTEMVALHSTSLALVITEGVGHQPVRATGLLMVHLETIANQLSGKPQIWILRPARLQSERAREYLIGIAKRRNVPVNMVYEEECQRIGLPPG
jgi:hypothetical protein